MSKYRDRREKIQQQQSKSLDNLQLYREASVAAARRHRQQEAAEVTKSTQKLQTSGAAAASSSSTKWKEHYALVSSIWGNVASSGADVPSSSVVWDEIKKQKERGGYPWTHLSHDQDAEVWIDPVKLPRDITTATLKRKDKSIPREWFHLPQGAQPPTVEDLLRDSSPDDNETMTAKFANADNPRDRAKSPPICGRGRSRSKERKPHKHDHGQQQKFVDDGGYEPVGKERSDRREAIQPLNKMSQMAAETKTSSFIGAKFSKNNSNNKQILPPRKAFTSLPEPPEVNRDTKPTVFDHTAGALINDQLQQQIMPKQTNGDESGGYEPVGLERRRKDYEDMDKSIPIPHEYAKVDKTKKSHELGHNGLPIDKLPIDKAKLEKEEQDKKLKEKEQKEKLEKENKLKEKMEKEQKVAEEKERKLKEKQEKEEKKAKEKLEREQREAEEKERKLKEKLEKEQKEKLEKERKLKEKLEKEQKEKEEKERKLIEKLEKEQKEKSEKEQKLSEEKERKMKEKQEKEQREKLEKEKKQKDKEEKERKMKEKLEREKLEKEQKDKEEKERKLKEKQDKKKKDKDEKQKKLKEKIENEEKEKNSKENKKEFNLTAKPFGKHVKEDYEKNHSKALETVFLQQQENEKDNKKNTVDHEVMVNTPIVLQDFPSRRSSLEEEEELNFSASDDQDLQDEQQHHDEFDELFNATATKQPPMNNDNNFDNQFLDNEQEPQHLTIHGDDYTCKPPISDKERKQMEKSQKIQKETEEKERKQKEKEEKKKEEKEKKLKAKEDKELEKINKRKLKEEMELQKQADKANKVKGLLELAKQKNLEQKQKEAFEQQSGISMKFEDVAEGHQITADDVLTTNGRENHNIITLNDDKEEEEEKTLTITQNTSSADPYYDEDIPQHVMMNGEQVDDDFEAQFLSTKNEAVNEALGDCETDSGIQGRSRKDKSSKIKGKNQDSTVLTNLKMPKMPEVHMPDMKAKLQDMNESIKQAKMPNPQEIKDGYLNSNFHKSFHQQLAVRTRVEGEDLQQIREHMTKNKTPAELAQMNHLFDIPIPKFKLLDKSSTSSKKQKKGADDVEMDSKSIDVQPLDDNKFRLYQTLPKSWREQNLVTSAKVLEDDDQAKSRRELVKTKTPAQLAEFNSFSDIPIPSRVKFILSPSERKIIAHQNRQRRKSSSSSVTGGKIQASSIIAFKRENFNLSLPRSWKETKLVTQTRDDLDLEEAKKRRLIVQSKSPKELAEIHGLEDIPLPSKVTTLFKQPKPDIKNFLTKSRSKSESNLKQANDSKSYWKDRMNAECLVRKRFEDPQVQASRAEMVKNKTVAELSQINSISDLPIPSTIQNLKETAMAHQQWPPKRLHQEHHHHQKALQEYVIPQSLKSPLLVSSKYEIHPEVLKERQDLVRSKSPTELSEINSLSDVPIPKFFKTPNSSRPVSPISQPDYSTWSGDIYNSLSRSMKSELLVRSKIENPDIQKQRAECCKAKSVGELSQIHSIDDIPLPTTLEHFVGRSTNTSGRPVERKKRFREMQRNLSVKSLQDKIENSSLTTQKLLVVSKYEDPEVLKERQKTVQSKSVSELAQISTLSDLPVPSRIEKLLPYNSQKSLKRSKSGDNIDKPKDYSHLSPMAIHDTIYSTLPRSMKSELKVRVIRCESPDVQRERKGLVENKTVSELSQVNSITDLPIPSPIQNLYGTGRKILTRPDGFDMDNLSQCTGITGRSSALAHYDIYASLPTSLKKEVLVRCKTENDYDTLQKRRDIVQNKTPKELSQISNFSEIPIPSRIEEWLHSSHESIGKIPNISRSWHELRSGFYDNLPKSLKGPALVRTKVERPEIQHVRSQIVYSKTPSQLSKIESWTDLPLPRLRKKAPRSRSQNSRHSRDRSPGDPKKMLPEALTKQCLVRCRTEDPNILKERKQMIQESSPHELSKIRNVNEFPLPVKRLQLPDIPLPSAKYLFKPPKRGRTVDEGCQTVESSFEGFTPVSTPRLLEGNFSDDEALRFEMSSPESLPRDTDFGYEVIDEDDKKESGEQADDDASSVSVADHYRGTPPLRGKKKKPPHRNEKNVDPKPLPRAKRDQRQTHGITQRVTRVTSDEEAPPPLPPKKSQMREASVETSSYHSLAVDNDSIQSRPLPTPPTPIRTKKTLVENSNDEDDITMGNTEVFHSLKSEKSKTFVNNDDDDDEITMANTEVFHSLISEKSETLIKNQRSSLTLVQDEDDDDNGDETLADSIIDSMHTCLDTVQSETAVDPDRTISDHANDSDDETEYLEEMLPLDPTARNETPTTPTIE